MKLKRTIAKVLTVISWSSGIVSASPSASPVSIPHIFSFDASKNGSSLSQDIKIDEYREYYFALQFNYSGEQDLFQLLNKVGNGSTYPDGRYEKPGVVIPVHLVIFAVNSSTNKTLLFDKIIDTQGSYSHEFTRVKFNGNYNRMIASIPLKPGVYHIQLSTVRDTQEFLGVPTYLNIEFRSKTFSSI